ncbi:MAG TPA: alpha-1,4-glucan--maltose-1-phosphate maltosyltransferase [Kofleriaceae bacterium]|jgi:starch synthase (maltosyl-transferring)
MESRGRVVILAIRPELDGGRYPIKRVAGDTLAIEVDAVADGHEVVRAMLLDRAPGATVWRETELVLGADDTWRASIVLPALGRHAYTAIAWVDAFASWRRGLDRKLAAGVDVRLDLLDGALLVERVDPAAAAALRAGSGDPTAPPSGGAAGRALGAAIDTALSIALADAMNRAPDRAHASRYHRELEVVVERPLAACSAWYELFPRSARGDGMHGTLRDAEARLPYVAELGFDIVYLPPIHPIGSSFRKGPDNAPVAGPNDPGSPWAIGNREGGHTAIHPQLGTLADFDRFVAAARAQRLEVALDIAFQASPDHPWVTEHPDWFVHRADGSIQYAENPPKKYQDVYPFDFESADWQALWAALRDVFVFWCEHGVRVFRVDNPHTKPIPFWEWCIGELHARFPDTIFLAEAFTRPKLMYALAKAGFSQSYTYFTWRTTKYELEAYSRDLASVADFFRPNFWPTTPDIFPEHLETGGRPAFMQRLVLAATLANNYGIYGPSYELGEHVRRQGVEELAANEKYQLRTWDLDRPDSLRHVIARMNQIRRSHPALQRGAPRFQPTDNELVIAYARTAPGQHAILVVVNLDPYHVHRAWLTLDLAALGLDADHAFAVHDLLGGGHYTWRGARNFVELDPAQLPAHVFEIRPYAKTEHDFEYFL